MAQLTTLPGFAGELVGTGVLMGNADPALHATGRISGHDL